MSTSASASSKSGESSRSASPAISMPESARRARSPRRKAGMGATSRTRIKSLPLGRCHLHGLRLTAAEDLHGDFFTHDITMQGSEQVIRVLQGLAVDLGQDVADEQAAGLSGTALFEPEYQQATFDRLCTDAQVTALYRAVLGQRLRDSPGDAGRDSERLT